MIDHAGLWLLIALSVNMWALISVLRSGTRPLWRIAWALVLLVPVLGFVLWFLLGPREKPAA